MNALQQIVRTIYQQREIYLRSHPIMPQDLVIRVSVNYRTRDEVRHFADQYFYAEPTKEEPKETLVGGPFEAIRDIPDNVYYLDFIVYNRVQKQLKFTLQPSDGVSS